MLAFGLAPLVPGASRLFGALTVAQCLAFSVPGVLAAWMSVFLHRRRGSDDRLYEASEAVESFLLYAGTLAKVFVTGTTWSVLWILPPFTAVFWANAKPFHSRMYVSIIVLAHGALVVAYVVRGDADASSAAWLTGAVGAACVATYEILARRGRNTLRLEAERNVLREKLSAVRLDGERERVAKMLRERVGAAIAALASELESDGLDEQAQSVLAELNGVARASAGAPMSLAELASRLDDRCRPLCVDVEYARSVVGDETASVEGHAAHALVRVSQELVKNAVIHGGARHVSIEVTLDAVATTLVVRDDGGGLAHGAFARATGGLDNARQWLLEHAGVLEHVVVAGGAATELRAVIPSVSADIASPHQRQAPHRDARTRMLGK